MWTSYIIFGKMNMLTALVILIIAVGFSLLTVWLVIKHQNEMDKVKPGDVVIVGDDEAEVLEVDGRFLIVKMRINKMKVSKKKSED